MKSAHERKMRIQAASGYQWPTTSCCGRFVSPSFSGRARVRVCVLRSARKQERPLATIIMNDADSTRSPLAYGARVMLIVGDLLLPLCPFALGCPASSRRAESGRPSAEPAACKLAASLARIKLGRRPKKHANLGSLGGASSALAGRAKPGANPKP